MSYPCKLNHTQTDYPCSAECPLFGDCVATYAKYRALCKEDAKPVRTKKAIERNDTGALVCTKCKTAASLRLDGQPGSFNFKIEPYCAHCGARLIEGDTE